MGVVAGVIILAAFISVFTAMNRATSGSRRSRYDGQQLIDPRTGQPVRHDRHGGSPGGHHGGHHGGGFSGGGHHGGGFSGGGDGGGGGHHG